MIVVPQACKSLLAEQRTDWGEDLCVKYGQELKKTYLGFRDYLPVGCRILDIGCGMSGIDVFLWHHYEGRAEVTLVDKDGVSDVINAGFHDCAETFSHYHDFGLALELLSCNGVPCPRCVDLLREPFPQDEFDVVISLLSWGFHYPISTYKPNVSAGGAIIADIRKGTSGEQELECFGEIIRVHEGKRHWRVVVRC